MNDRTKPMPYEPTSLIDALIELQHTMGITRLMTPIEIVREAAWRASRPEQIKNAEWHPRAPLPDQRMADEP
jgi:hypothetical protein